MWLGAFDHPAALIGWLSSDFYAFIRPDTLRSISNSSDGGAGVLKLDSLAQRIPCGLAIRICHAGCRSGAGHHELAGAPHHTPNAALLHSSHHQRMVRWNRAGVACRSALHAGSRLLLCAREPDADGKHRQPAIHPPVLIVSPARLLDKCSTAEGRGGAQGGAR